jgi:hypothetical protein
MDTTEIRQEIIELKNKNKALEDEIQEYKNDMRKEGMGSATWNKLSDLILSNQANIRINQQSISSLQSQLVTANSCKRFENITYYFLMFKNIFSKILFMLELICFKNEHTFT